MPADAISSLDDERDSFDEMKIISFEIEDDIEEDDKPGLIIDGQHRLFGINMYDGSIRVNVVALLNVDVLESAFQFLVINNKVSKVSTDHIRTLALDYQNKEDELKERLRTARLSLNENLPFVGIIDKDESSPFFNSLTLEEVEADPEKRFVSPAAIEQAINIIKSQRISDLDGEDAICDFFYAIWNPIKERWPELWNRNSKLMHKVSIIAVTNYFTDMLIARYDLDGIDVTDPEEVKKIVKSLLKNQTPEFWTADWSIKISDAQAVRSKIVKSLIQVSRNVRSQAPWNQDVDLIDLREDEMAPPDIS